MSFALESAPSAASLGFGTFLAKLTGLGLFGFSLWGILAASTVLEHERFPVAGEILVDGRPAAGAKVRLYRLQDEANLARAVAWGRTDEHGAFVVKTLGWADGVPEGKYAVTVAYEPATVRGEEYLPGPHVLAEELAHPRTTPLVVEVLAEPNQLGVLELETPKARLEIDRDSRWSLSQISPSGALP
jgi:hypothetical protein